MFSIGKELQLKAWFECIYLYCKDLQNRFILTVYSECMRWSIDVLLASCLHYLQVVPLIQIQKTRKMKTSLYLQRLSIGWPMLRDFHTDMAFLTQYEGLFCLSELVVVLQSPFWQLHLNGFLMLRWIIDPAKCASSVTMKKASCGFFHTFSFKKQSKNL